MARPRARTPSWRAALERSGRRGARRPSTSPARREPATRTVLVRAGHPATRRQPTDRRRPAEDRPWLAGMDRLDDPRLARRFVTSRLLYRRLRRYLWAPPAGRWPPSPCCCGSTSSSTASATSFRSPAPAERAAAGLRRLVVLPLRRHPGHRGRRCWPCWRVVVALTSRGIWRALGGDGLPAPWAGGVRGRARSRHAQLADRRRGRPRRHPRRHRGRRHRASSPAGRCVPS